MQTASGTGRARPAGPRTGRLTLLLGALAAGLWAGQGFASGPPEGLEAVAALLAEMPAGVGCPSSDREAWDALAGHRAFRDAVARAEKHLRELPADLPDDLYLDFSRTGNRTRWQERVGQLDRRFRDLVLGECVEHAGRFLPAIRECIGVYAAQRTWVLPAHDRSLANFEGRTIEIDLRAALLAWDLATADWLLGDRLGQETRGLIREQVGRRVLDPFTEMQLGRRPAAHWMSTTNNWNAVCHAGVVGAALAIVPQRQRRAFFVAAARANTRRFLEGFTPDGYCSEGVSYWNYGFGHYVLLAETVYRAAGGRLDLLAGEDVRRPAGYGVGIEIIDGVFPAFADCPVTASSSRSVLHLLQRRIGLGRPDLEASDPVTTETSLPAAMIYAFPSPGPTASASAPAGTPVRPLRSWFRHAGVLIGRPAAGSGTRMGVALKGGHNAEHHNHNDVGSFVVVVGGRPVLLDPGGEVYTARTFSDRRYESRLLNSWGHPVPVVDGRLQRTGAEARAEVVSTEFTDAHDTLVLDLGAAYDVPGLRSLRRTFVYAREGAGSLTVIDEAAFEAPSTFETALVTTGGFEQVGEGVLEFRDGPAGVRVVLETGDRPVRVQAEPIEEEAMSRIRPVRVGIAAAEPAEAFRVTLRILPVDPAGR